MVRKEVDGVVVLASGALRGCLGCELWARVDEPYAQCDGKDYHFRLKDFAVVYADPRLLVVRVTARLLQCTFRMMSARPGGQTW